MNYLDGLGATRVTFCVSRNSFALIAVRQVQISTLFLQQKEMRAGIVKRGRQYFSNVFFVI